METALVTDGRPSKYYFSLLLRYRLPPGLLDPRLKYRIPSRIDTR